MWCLHPLEAGNVASAHYEWRTNAPAVFFKGSPTKHQNLTLGYSTHLLNTGLLAETMSKITFTAHSIVPLMLLHAPVRYFICDAAVLTQLSPTFLMENVSKNLQL